MDPRDRCNGFLPQKKKKKRKERKKEKSLKDIFGKMAFIFKSQDIYKSIYRF